MKILIVEDENVIAEHLQQIVGPLLKKFPGSEVLVVGEFAQAVRIASREHPDAIILDLSLLDSTMDQTISRLEELHVHSAIVICSGHSKHLFEKLVPPDVEILEKHELFSDQSLLSKLIMRAIEKWKAREYVPFDEGVQKLRSILNTPTPQNATPE